MRPNRSRLALTFIGNEISMSSTMTKENRVLKVVLAILLPPLAVFLEKGLGIQFALNVILTLIGFWIIGIVHALFVVL